MAGARPRWVLHLQAQMWRFLMGIGMFLHKIARPRPPKPNFSRTVKSTVSTKEGSFEMYFYTPPTYEHERRHAFSSSQSKSRRSGRRKSVIEKGGYPCIINFHGGGFTLGTATDDARWCVTAVEQCDAIVVSVAYRLAPENPFPTAVEDGVDAVLYIANHAQELGINPNKIALSGFSSGANMAFTVPLRLYDHLTEFSRTMSRNGSSNSLTWTPTVNSTVPSRPPSSSLRPQYLTAMTSASTTSVNRILRSRSATQVAQRDETAYLSSKAAKVSINSLPECGVQIAAIVPWYPSTDYTQTRSQRRETTVRKDQDLPALFTDLFDESYLHPPDTIPLDSPYLSPGIADTQLLKEALPQEIILHTCQWDMLLSEGEKFKDRLVSEQIGKNVIYNMIPNVKHGWDKAPNPIKPTPGVKEHYLRACDELRRVFAEVDKMDKLRQMGQGGNSDGFGAGVMNQSVYGQGDDGGASGGVNGSSADALSTVSSGDGSEYELEDSFARAGRRESKLVR